MKLIVTIPAYNEEKTLGEVIRSIPKKINGLKEIETLVWDDGSEDKTKEIAKKAGSNYVFSNKNNLGLAKTFDKASKKAVELGADIVVNTDADNQYDQKEIEKLIEPILQNKADFVNGDRQVEKLEHMPMAKKYGNMLGSLIIRILTGCKLNDASSGFRAYSKECIEKFNLLSKHTYTHETIIQALENDMRIVEIPVTFKKRGTGNSKLISNVFSHVKKSGSTIIRTIAMYKAFKFFLSIGVFMTLIGIFGGIRFLYFYFTDGGDGHIQSLIFSSILFNIGFTTIVMGVLADLISVNRRLIERK